jgi:hypothetical protein
MVRDAAARELFAIGEGAEPALRHVLSAKPSLEVQRRVEQLMSRLPSYPINSPERLRTIRAIQVLERLGTADARRLLGELTVGAAEALLTHEARRAMNRLSAQKVGR